MQYVRRPPLLSKSTVSRVWIRCDSSTTVGDYPAKADCCPQVVTKEVPVDRVVERLVEVPIEIEKVFPNKSPLPPPPSTDISRPTAHVKCFSIMFRGTRPLSLLAMSPLRVSSLVQDLPAPTTRRQLHITANVYRLA